MEQEETPCLRWGRPQQGVSPEGKGWTEGSDEASCKRTAQAPAAQLSLLTPTPFYRATTNTSRSSLPESLPVRPAPQRGDRPLWVTSEKLFRTVLEMQPKGDRLGGCPHKSLSEEGGRRDPARQRPASWLLQPKLSTERRAGRPPTTLPPPGLPMALALPPEVEILELGAGLVLLKLTFSPMTDQGLRVGSGARDHHGGPQQRPHRQLPPRTGSRPHDHQVT